MNDLIVRTYREGDEDEIARLLNECFDSFKSFALTGEKWLKISELDPGFRKDLAFVAEKDGKIVSHVQIIAREITVGSAARLQVAGIGNVSTSREYRRTGISTKLSMHALQVAKERGFPASALFTSPQIPAHRIYLRIGFTDVYSPVFLLRALKSPLKWGNDKAKPTLSQRKVKIRESNESDDPSLLKIYEKNYDAYNGLAVRNLKEWKSKFRNRFFYECPFYEESPESSNLVVADADAGEVVGYAMSCFTQRDKLGHVCEVMSLPGWEKEAGLLLAERLLSDLAEAKPASLLIYSSENTLVDRLFREGSSPLEGVNVFMFKILNVKALMESLFHLTSPARKFVSQVFQDWRGAIILQIAGGESVTMKFDGETTSIREGEERSGEKVTFSDPESFAKILFGGKSFMDLIIEKKVNVSMDHAKRGEVVKILEKTFPKKPILTCPSDKW
jgi:predicted acetyltransferase